MVGGGWSSIEPVVPRRINAVVIGMPLAGYTLDEQFGGDGCVAAVLCVVCDPAKAQVCLLARQRVGHRSGRSWLDNISLEQKVWLVETDSDDRG